MGCLAKLFLILSLGLSYLKNTVEKLSKLLILGAL